MSNKMACSVVVPVFNSQDSLYRLIDELATILPVVGEQYEVILINDGSQDQSWNVINKLAGLYPWVRGIDLMRNYGQHNALLCGIRAAKYGTIVTIDDDLQNPPAEIPHLLARLSDGYDVVYGTPRERQHNFWRNLGSVMIRLALRAAMGTNAAHYVSSFRAFRTQLREVFIDSRFPHTSIDVLLSWGTDRFGMVPVHHEPRRSGSSTYTFRKLVMLSIDMLTGFSTLPLQLASWVGFSVALFGVAVMIYVLGRFFALGYSIPGFPFLASTIAIFSGAQLFAIGIIGEYLARMHLRMMGKPPYGVRQHLTYEAKTDD